MVLACVRRLTRPVGFRFCGMMLLVPVSGPSVKGRNQVCVERVLHVAGKSEELGKPDPVDGETGGAQRRAAERRLIHARPGLAVAVGVARKRLHVAAEIVTERNRLRLHAPGVGRDDRIPMGLGHRQQHVTRVDEPAEGGEGVVAREEPAERGADVLAASSRMDPCDVRSADGDERLLNDEVIAGARRAGRVARGDHLGDRGSDARPKIAWHDTLLDHHDG